MHQHSSGCRPNGYAVWRARSNGLKSLASAFNIFFSFLFQFFFFSFFCTNKTAACPVCPLFALEFFFDLNNSHSTNRCCGSLLDSLCFRQSALSLTHSAASPSHKRIFVRAFGFWPSFYMKIHKQYTSAMSTVVVACKSHDSFFSLYQNMYTICYDNMASHWRTDAGRSFACRHFANES